MRARNWPGPESHLLGGAAPRRPSQVDPKGRRSSSAPQSERPRGSPLVLPAVGCARGHGDPRFHSLPGPRVAFRRRRVVVDRLRDVGGRRLLSQWTPVRSSALHDRRDSLPRARRPGSARPPCLDSFQLEPLLARFLRNPCPQLRPREALEEICLIGSRISRTQGMGASALQSMGNSERGSATLESRLGSLSPGPHKVDDTP